MFGHSHGFDMEEVVVNYLKYRPTYASEIYEKILLCMDQHSRELESAWSLAVDVGCGTGFSTIPLAKYFEKVIGIDTSLPSIKLAKQLSGEYSNIDYHHCSAEDMGSIVADESVDLVTAGAALHWMDIKKVSQECLRILKPGGVLASYSYSMPFMEDQRVSEHMKWLSAIIQKYVAYEGHHIFNNYQEICPLLSEFLSQCVRDDTIRMSFPYSIGDYLGFMKSTPEYYIYQADHPHHPNAYDDVIEKLASYFFKY